MGFARGPQEQLQMGDARGRVDPTRPRPNTNWWNTGRVGGGSGMPGSDWSTGLTFGGDWSDDEEDREALEERRVERKRKGLGVAEEVEICVVDWP